MNTTVIDIERLPAELASDLDGSFADLVEALQNDVFSGALRMTGNRADAEDIAQEAFVRAYRALAEYPADRIRAMQLRGWVWTIAANLCRNHARSRSRKPEASLPDHLPVADPSPSPEQLTLGSDTREHLAGLVSDLPWAQREAVVMRHVVGFGYAEIADALDRPLGTVKADVHRGLARLRDALDLEEIR